MFRAPGWLLALTFTAFAFATDDYVIAGVLPAISGGLGVSEAAGGQLVTAFSLAFALTAPVASVVTASWPRRRLITGALLLFVAANWASALVSSYPVLMGLRVLAAVAAAAVVPAAYAIAASLAPEGHQGRYLALVMGGLTGSLVLGVPIGTWVGGAFGWQATFVLGGLLGLASLVAVHRTLPDVRDLVPAETHPTTEPEPKTPTGPDPGPAPGDATAVGDATVPDPAASASAPASALASAGAAGAALVSGDASESGDAPPFGPAPVPASASASASASAPALGGASASGSPSGSAAALASAGVRDSGSEGAEAPAGVRGSWGGVWGRVRALGRPRVLLGLLGMVAIVTGSMMLLTYLAPFLRDLAGAGPRELGWVFALAGVAGLAGGMLGGRAADRWGPERALLAGIGGFAAVMAVFVGSWFLRPVPLLWLLPVLLVWAGLSWWIPPPAQTRLLALAGTAGPQALALNSSAVYVGVSAGGALGGLVLETYGSGVLPVVAAVVELAALALFWAAARLGR
ncbi:MFS transporter [Nonomuraea sp. NPDC049725]|uniref:MFS transporter n=1 Tax=Nonomuraea sp. NPDC049725 TaxID=3154508 RepID=UPI003447E0EF